MRKLERDIKKELLERLKKRPDVYAWTAASGLVKGAGGTFRTNVKGIADVCGILKGGYALYIETKRPGQKQRDTQTEFQAKIEHLGGLYIVAYSAQEAIDEIDLFMQTVNIEA